MPKSLDQLFAEAEAVERPLRLLVYGLPKTGKSHLVASGAEVGPLYWMDTEGGSDFYDPAEGHGFRVLRSTDPNLALEAIEAANQAIGNNGHGPRPVISLDSFSSIWFAQQEVAEQLTKQWSRGRRSDRASFRAWGPAKAPLKRLYNALMTTRCHVIFTARGKVKYEVAGNGEPSEVGLVPDVERNLPYAVDLVVETGVGDVPRGKQPKPSDFLATVMGGRSSALPIGTEFKDPTLQDFLSAASLEGVVPEAMKDSVDGQVQQALTTPQSWKALQGKLNAAGIDVEKVKAELHEQFGKFSTRKLDEYWIHLTGQHPELLEDDAEPGS